MIEFIFIIYFGFNIAFTLFVLSYDFDSCIFGREVNKLSLLFMGILFGCFIYLISLFDKVSCSLSLRGRNREDESRGVVRVFNDFNNFSF